MSNQVQSRVKSFTYVKDWANGPNSVLHVHNIEFENGAKGICYCKTMNPEAYSAGAELVYEISGKNNDIVKIVKIVPPPSAQSNNNSYPQRMTQTKQSDLIGSAFCHAKDIVIAKLNQQKAVLNSDAVINAKKPTVKAATIDSLLYDPVSDLCSSAEIIYNKMKELRNAEIAESEIPPVS